MLFPPYAWLMPTPLFLFLSHSTLCHHECLISCAKHTDYWPKKGAKQDVIGLNEALFLHLPYVCKRLLTLSFLSKFVLNFSYPRFFSSSFSLLSFFFFILFFLLLFSIFFFFLFSSFFSFASETFFASFQNIQFYCSVSFPDLSQSISVFVLTFPSFPPSFLLSFLLSLSWDCSPSYSILVLLLSPFDFFS